MKKFVNISIVLIMAIMICGCSINITIGNDDKEKETTETTEAVSRQYVGTEIDFSYYGNSSMDGSSKRRYEWENNDNYEYFVVTVEKNSGDVVEDRTMSSYYDVGYGTTVQKVVGYKLED